MWTNNATGTDDATGQALIQALSDQDIEEAIDAATAVGDDRIQSRSGGRVNPEQWTHGSSAERVKWFQTGYTTGDLAACDTFAANAL
jgi:predicted metalloprotease